MAGRHSAAANRRVENSTCGSYHDLQEDAEKYESRREYGKAIDFYTQALKARQSLAAFKGSQTIGTVTATDAGHEGAIFYLRIAIWKCQKNMGMNVPRPMRAPAKNAPASPATAPPAAAPPAAAPPAAAAPAAAPPAALPNAPAVLLRRGVLGTLPLHTLPINPQHKGTLLGPQPFLPRSNGAVMQRKVILAVPLDQNERSAIFHRQR